MASEKHLDYLNILAIQNAGGTCPYCYSRSGHYEMCVLMQGEGDGEEKLEMEIKQFETWQQGDWPVTTEDWKRAFSLQ